MNISSAVVVTEPQYLQDVLQSLKESGLCDIYFHDEEGRIIVIIEGEDVNEETFKLKEIQMLPHVLSASMIYSYSEEEWESASEYLQKLSNDVPEILNDDNVKAEDIVYKGHIKGYIS